MSATLPVSSVSSRYGMRAIITNDSVSIGLVAAFVAELVIFSFASPYFLSFANFMNIGTAITINGIVAVGATIIILSGGFDLSVGATMAVSGMISAYFVNQGFNLGIALPSALAAGVLVGILNGVIIAHGRINPLITTLGTLAVVRGLGYVISGGLELPIEDQAYLAIGTHRIFGIPLLVWLLISIFLLFALAMPHTRFGRYTYAIGSNARAARLAGVPVNRWRVVFYATGSLLAAVGGVLTVARVGTAQPSANIGAELLVITAVILGGTRLTGGKGNLFGTFIGLIVLGTLSNGLILLSVPAYWQQVVQGLALLAAVLYGETKNRTEGD